MLSQSLYLGTSDTTVYTKANLGVNNVFVFAKGTKRSYFITRTVRFDAKSEGEMETYENQIYAGGSDIDQGIAFLEAIDLAKQYVRADSKGFVEYSRNKRVQENGGTGGKNSSYDRVGDQRGGDTEGSGGDGSRPVSHIRRALPDTTETFCAKKRATARVAPSCKKREVAIGCRATNGR